MYSLGTDPEVFTIQNGAVVPAYFALGGKSHELPHGTLVGDGAAVEFSVTPDTDPAIVSQRVQENLAAATTIVRDVLQDGSVQLVPKPWSEISMTHIEQLPESFGTQFSLQILGCAPDESVYAWVHQERPDPRTYPARTTGGHIHVELPTDVLTNRVLRLHIGVALDAVLNVTCQQFTAPRAAESAMRRYELYGLPGMHRTSKYGTFEYRCLPAMALAGASETATWFFSTTQRLLVPMVNAWVQNHDDGLDMMRECSASLDWVRQLVSTLRAGNVAAAIELRNRYLERWQEEYDLSLPMPESMEIAYD